MLVIRSMQISGFRSFRGEETMKFPRGGGFFLLTGDNQVEPDLGANGAGKSSVWDAMVWAFYGKTTRGLRASNVANWSQNDLCRVAVVFELNDVEHTLIRTWSPNSLSLRTVETEPRVVTQEEVDAILGLDFDAFLNVAVMGQFNQYFFDLSPTEKLSVFSCALGLDRWIRASDSARKRALELQVKAQSAAVAHAKLEGRLQSAEGELVRQRERLEGYDTQVKDKREQLEYVKSVRADEADGLRKLHKTGGKRYDKALAQRDGLNRKLLKLDDAEKKCRDDTHDTELRLASIQSVLNASKNVENKVRGAAEQGKCSTCKQKVPQSHLITIVGSMTRKRRQLQGERDEVAVTHKELREAHEFAVAAKKTCDAELTKVERLFMDIQNETSMLLRELSKAERGVAEAEEQLSALDSAENPYADRVAELTESVPRLRLQMHATMRIQGSIASLADDVRGWSKRFKDLRLWVIQTALGELEMVVNSSLAELGLSGWRIEFDVEHQNKSGGVTKGFSVFIYAPGSDDPTPWDAWSGGELQRLRIAGALGLSSLLSGRSGTAVGFEIWDEPSAHLSEEGIEDMLRFFETRARTSGKQVWLVDHRSLTHGGFDAEYCVTKTKNGSRISKVGS